MYGLLKGLRVVEGASFVAAPSCGLHLLQLGAEVIRFDQVGGGPDFRRWPQSADGASFYWEGLNKGKKSIAIDLRRPEGRELATRIASAPGENAGIVLTNYPANGFLSHQRLAALRPDIITVRVSGWSDGRSAVDYTVNCAVGLPDMTGSVSANGPVNHVLPAWDLMTGLYAACALLAAERSRKETGNGQEIVVPLSDVAMATLGNLGQVAEVSEHGIDRPRMGNDLYGAFGRDFACADGRRVMIVAITARQWSGLLKALDIAGEVQALEAERGVSFAADEGIRFKHRDRLFAIVQGAVNRLSFAQLSAAFDAADVCWGPYRGLLQALKEPGGFPVVSDIFSKIAHPSGPSYPTPGFAATFKNEERQPARRAPRLGEHTDEVLAEILDFPEHEIARMHDNGLVAGPGA